MAIIDPIVKALGDSGVWLADINVWSILIRLLLAIIFGGLFGIERAVKRHAAGLRTYILVTLGAAIGGILNQFICMSTGADGARIAAGVVTGIGFLGVGMIVVTSRNQIRGLTTAAALWASGCLGVTIGQGFYTVGLIGGVLLTVCLMFISPIEEYFTGKARTFTVHVELSARTDLKDLLEHLRSNQIKVMNVEHNVAYAASGLSVYTLIITDQHKHKEIIGQQEIVRRIEALPYVNHAETLN